MVSEEEKGPGEVTNSYRTSDMYQMRGGPAPSYESSVQAASSKNNVNSIRPRSDYFLWLDVITVK